MVKSDIKIYRYIFVFFFKWERVWFLLLIIEVVFFSILVLMRFDILNNIFDFGLN